MPKHDTEHLSPDDSPDWSQNDRWLAVIDHMFDLSKRLPDEHWMIACAQNLAAVIVEIEDGITEEQQAVLMGIGAYIIREGRKEFRASIQTLVGLGKIKPTK